MEMGNANQTLIKYRNQMRPVTCQSFIVEQIKQNDGDPWPGQDQGHNQQPGHRRAEGHNHFVQKGRCLIGPSRRGGLPAPRLAAHWCHELRKENGLIKCDTSATICCDSGMIRANSAPCGESQQHWMSIIEHVMTSSSVCNKKEDSALLEVSINTSRYQIMEK